MKIFRFVSAFCFATSSSVRSCGVVAPDGKSESGSCEVFVEGRFSNDKPFGSDWER